MGRIPKHEYTDKKCYTMYNRKAKSGIKKIPYDLFEGWYKGKEKKCVYCGITEAESKILFDHYPDGTRGGRRGKYLEIERKSSCQLYDNLENLELACYWCNNAKSNYFNASEFMEIGQIIGRINKKRINDIEMGKYFGGT